MNQRNVLMFHSDLELSETQRQHVCSSCGHIMIPGRESLLTLETEKALRKNHRRRAGPAQQKPPASSSSTSASAGVYKKLTCGMCGRYTRIGIPPASRIIRTRPKRNKATGAATTALAPAPAAQATAIQTASEAPKASANASSKKRAKNRKQGLQALLQQSQATGSSRGGGALGGLGLSLTDFMKK